MSRAESPARKQALKLWIKSGRLLKPKEIAAQLGVSDSMVRKWKSIDKWSAVPDPVPRKRGAQKGSKNAKGNKGGPGGPPGNDKAVKHGFFRKFLPDDEETLEIFDATAELSPLDILWTQIRILFTNIMRAQKITFVRDRDDQTMVIKKAKGTMMGGEDKSGDVLEHIEYEYQHAWDKQNNTLSAQSAAMGKLTSMLKQYEEMLRSLPPEAVQEEHQMRVEKLKAEIKALDKPSGGEKDSGNIDQLADIIKKSAEAIRSVE